MSGVTPGALRIVLAGLFVVATIAFAVTTAAWPPTADGAAMAYVGVGLALYVLISLACHQERRRER
jgi:hypothetical protein